MKVYKKGFTLIEIMVVITIITILLSMVIISAKKQKTRARDRVRASDINTIRLAVEEYKLYCGEYPNKIEQNTDNGHCPSGVNFGYFLKNIPVAPRHSNPVFTGGSGIYKLSEIENSGYLYAGLSTTQTGKCYDYHIAAEMEGDSSFLSKDHDAVKGSGKYKTKCDGSNIDFGSSNDDTKGFLYDFRSNSSNSNLN